MFPESGPGIGLLLLRLCVAATLLLELPAQSLLRIALVLLASSIALGALTAICCAMGFLLMAVVVIDSGAQSPSALVGLTMIVAMVLLGPGAYSVDARLFGRRELSLSSGRRPRR